MISRAERLLDDTGWRILDALQANARIAFSELGRQVGLSAPAVAERVRNMEDAGLITGYRVELGLEKLGFPIAAIIRVAAPEEKCARLKTLVQGLAEVLECHHVTGADAYVLKVGTPATAVVLSSPVARGASSTLRTRRGRAVDSHGPPRSAGRRDARLVHLGRRELVLARGARAARARCRRLGPDHPSHPRGALGREARG